MDYDAEFYRARAGQTFTVADSDAVVLTLDKVSVISRSPRPSGGFILEFTGSAATPLDQRTWPLTQDGETHDIFLVPIAREGDLLRYEAVFN